MKIAMLVSAVAGVLFFAAGCTTVTEVDTGKEFSIITEEEEKELEKTGRQYGEEILQAIRDTDYELLTRHMMEEHLKDVNEAEFRKSCENYRKHSGEQREATYLGSMRNGPLVRIYVWKVEFAKAGKDKDGEETTLVYDKLFTTVVAKSDGQYYVLGFRFP